MEIPAIDLNRMQAICRLLPGEDLPKKLTDKYWAFKRCMDRIGERITGSDVARLCAEQGYGKPLDGDYKGPTVADLWRQRKVQPDTKVMVEWRGDLVEGVLRRVDGANQCIVQLEGEVEERKFNVDRVTLAA